MIRADDSQISTARLVLRALHMDDAAAMVALADNLNVAAMTARLPHPYTHDDAVSFIAGIDPNVKDTHVYAITTAEDDAFVGCCGVERVDEAASPNFGYWLGEPYWGRGYATEAAQALVDNIFSTTDIGALQAGCRVINAGSRRVLQKCGFRYLSNGTSQTRSLGQTVTIEQYSLERRTWLSLRGATGLEEALAEAEAEAS